MSNERENNNKEQEKVHKFPKQEKPGFDLVMLFLNDNFAGDSLTVHDAIVEIMDEHKIPLENQEIRMLLAEMCNKLTTKMENYDF